MRQEAAGRDLAFWISQALPALEAEPGQTRNGRVVSMVNVTADQRAVARKCNQMLFWLLVHEASMIRLPKVVVDTNAK